MGNIQDLDTWFVHGIAAGNYVQRLYHPMAELTRVTQNTVPVLLKPSHVAPMFFRKSVPRDQHCQSEARHNGTKWRAGR